MTRWSGKCVRIWCIAPALELGDGKVPDAKTLARLGQVNGPEVIRDWHERLVALARRLW
jgi:hypothetical protein